MSKPPPLPFHDVQKKSWYRIAFLKTFTDIFTCILFYSLYWSQNPLSTPVTRSCNFTKTCFKVWLLCTLIPGGFCWTSLVLNLTLKTHPGWGLQCCEISFHPLIQEVRPSKLGIGSHVAFREGHRNTSFHVQSCIHFYQDIFIFTMYNINIYNPQILRANNILPQLISVQIIHKIPFKTSLNFLNKLSSPGILFILRKSQIHLTPLS